tara:strand:+ start:164 stop:430 length:267 start_codon:yes stop_codon:yes gene_type:complete
MNETMKEQRMNELAIEFGADVFDSNGVAGFGSLPQVPLFLNWLRSRGETEIAELADRSPRYWFPRCPEVVTTSDNMIEEGTPCRQPIV